MAKANVELSQATLANEKCRFMDKLLKVIKNNPNSRIMKMLRQELGKISASQEVKIGYETEYLSLLRRSCLMQTTVSSPVNGRQKPASEMKLSDDVIKSCSVVQELSWPQKNVEVGSVEQSDDTVKS